MTLPVCALGDEEREKIERLVRAQSAPVRLVRLVRLVRRARSIQLAAQGLTAPAIAQQVGVSEKAVRQRLERCAVEGMAGLDDAARAGRPRTYPADVSSRVVAKARGLPPQPTETATGRWRRPATGPGIGSTPNWRRRG